MRTEKEKARLMLEATFVFALWQYPKNYKAYAKKIVNADEFFEHQASRFFFSLGYQMYQSGYEVFDDITIITYLDSIPTLKATFDRYGGISTVQSMMKTKTSQSNIEAYCVDLMKQNCIESLRKINMLSDGDEELLSCMSIEQMRMFYSNKINNIFYKKGANAKVQSVEISDEDIQYFHDGKEYGLSIANTSPLLNYEIMGLNKGLTFIGGTVNSGKTSLTLGITVKSWLLNKIKCCLISNEQGLMEFKRMLLAMAVFEVYGESTDISRRRIKAGHFSKEERGYLQKAKDYLNENFAPYLKFVEMSDYSIDEVRMIIDYLSTMGYGGFVYDVFKAESKQAQVIQGLKDMSNELFLTSKNNGVSTVATVQLGLSYNNVRFLTMDCISTSKQIVEPATEVLLLRKMWNDEISGGQFDVKIYNFLYDTDGRVMKDAKGIPMKKYRETTVDEYTKIILLFISKTRNGERDKCIAYKFNGDYNYWEELGYCTPAWEDRRKGGQN